MTDTTVVLDAEQVEQIFRDCMFQPDENPREYVPAPGITINVGFHPGRLEKYREEISKMLEELPDTFKESGGGGMSFLEACFDRHGTQWTGLHLRMEQLFQLGLAIGKVGCPMPRTLWGLLPGSMPYYVVYDDCKEVELRAV